jgi:hypothetical protein
LQQIVERHAFETDLHLASAIGLQSFNSEAIGLTGLTECARSN